MYTTAEYITHILYILLKAKKAIEKRNETENRHNTGQSTQYTEKRAHTTRDKKVIFHILIIVDLYSICNLTFRYTYTIYGILSQYWATMQNLNIFNPGDSSINIVILLMISSFVYFQPIGPLVALYFILIGLTFYRKQLS